MPSTRPHCLPPKDLSPGPGVAQPRTLCPAEASPSHGPQPQAVAGGEVTAAVGGFGTSWTTEPSWKPSLWHSSPRLERLLARSTPSGSREPRRKAWIRGSRCLTTMSPAREERAQRSRQCRADGTARLPARRPLRVPAQPRDRSSGPLCVLQNSWVQYLEHRAARSLTPCAAGDRAPPPW